MTNMATFMKKTGFALAIAFSMLAMAFGVCLLGGHQAYAETLETPFGVTDDVTRIEVTKLAKDDHTYVAGAEMAIIEKDTGTVVASWTTGKEAYMVEKVLDVNKQYILREVKAPSGFDKVGDMVFVVTPSEEEGITVISLPADVEQTGSYSVSLYDTRLPVEQVVTQRNTSVVAPKTGDETPYELCAGIALACLAGIVVLQVVKTRKKDGAGA